MNFIFLALVQKAYCSRKDYKIGKVRGKVVPVLN
jgi:hypothetical protein